MSLLVFQHEKTETPAALGATLRDYGHKLRVIDLYAGQSVPADLDDVDAILSMGGTPNVDEAAKFPWITAELAYLKLAHEKKVPIVGMCLGAQLIAAALGGAVAAMPTPEVGWQNVKLSFFGSTDPIFGGVAWDTMQMHLHGQEVTKLPPDSQPLAGSKACKNQAFKVGLTTYAFQFHFEWLPSDIKAVASDPLIPKAGGSGEQIVRDIDTHIAGYRRVGDRLASNIAELLFPIDKR